MTKYLVKIISICSFIVLIPVIIVGVALSAVGSSMFKLDLFVAGLEEGVGYTLTIGEKDKDKEEGSSASFMKGSEVNVNFSAAGYDFLGWYAGDNTTAKLDGEPVANKDNASYTFTLNGNTQLTAKVAVKTFTVSVVNAKYDDNTDLNIEGPVTYTYGQKLFPNIEAKNKPNTILAGWKFADPLMGEQVYTHATFNESNKEYALVPVWIERTRVEYYTDTTESVLMYTQYLTKDEFATFELAGLDNETISSHIPEGFEFKGWADASGVETNASEIRRHEFNATTTHKVYLNTKANVYTISVKANSEDTAAKTLIYTAGEGYKWEGQAAQRMYYTMTGLKTSDGTVYTKKGEEYVNSVGLSFSRMMIENNKTSIDATAVWTCDYPEVSVNYSIYGGKVIYGKKTSDSIPELIIDSLSGFQEGRMLVKFADDTEGSYKLEDSILETIFGEYQSFWMVDETAEGGYKEVEVTSVHVYWSADGAAIDTNQASFTYGIYKLLEGNADYNLETNPLKISFMFNDKL